MSSVLEWFLMEGYGFYVWSAYVLAIGFFLTLGCLLKKLALQKRLAYESLTQKKSNVFAGFPPPRE